jgi:Sec-independent protein translocase protein TatA
MRHLVAIFVIALVVAGCSKPQDIVFGSEPLKQIAEQGEQFKKLPEEDRTLLVGYLTITEMGKVFGAEIKPTTGRTVGEVLADARAWKEKMKAAEAEAKKREAEAEALKVKVLAERKAVADKISSSVVVAVIDKTVLPKNYDAGRYNEMLSIKYAIENKSSKAIRQLKGRVVFNDATGDKVGWLPVDFDEPIGAGKSLTTTTGRGWKLNPFMNGEIEKIAGREFSSMKATFEPESIAFEGGEVLKAPSLEP